MLLSPWDPAVVRGWLEGRSIEVLTAPDPPAPDALLALAPDADLVINMSGYPRARAFARCDWHKVEDWDVEDPYGSDPQVYQRIFEDIRTRIETLAARLRERESL